VRLEDGFAQPTEVSRFERADKNTWLRIVVTEGRPHLVGFACSRSPPRAGARPPAGDRLLAPS
jgi:hypothetical protein